MKTEFSCHGCQKRFPGCHSTCPEYTQEKAEHEKRRTQEAKERAVQLGLAAQRSMAVHRAFKKDKRHSKNWHGEGA